MSGIEKIKSNKYAMAAIKEMGFDENLELKGEFNGEEYTVKIFLGVDSWSGGEMIKVASSFPIEEEGEELEFNEEEAVSLSEFMMMYPY